MSENDTEQNEQGEQAGTGTFMDEPPLVTEGDPSGTQKVGVSGKRDPLAVDYAAVTLPSGSYEDATVEERRAVILHRIEQAGHPRAIPYTYKELGDEFGVAKSQISTDMSILADWCAENVERDHVAIMDAVFRGAVLDLVQDGKRAWAAEVGKEWFEWLADMGAIERVPEHVSLDATIREGTDETDEYRIVDDDEAEALQAARGEQGAASARALDDGLTDEAEAEVE